ncbi:MAG: 1,4-dihydroxy-6-naphthoate synthase [Ferruginibacter sp.]
MKLTLGFSPCPNDTFIFDALVNNKIDTGDLSFEAVMEDVETLNRWAIEGRLDITKLSYGVLPLVLDEYVVLNSGSALGSGVGPLLISNRPAGQAGMEENTRGVEKQQIAIPGEHTTAHLLFSMAYPNAKNKIFMRYDEIESFVLEGKGLGVIIHENRFTYTAKGLHKIIDLGDYWEKETNKPIPLGGIVIKRSVATEISLRTDLLIRKSIEHAFDNHYPAITEFVKSNSQEMNEDVMLKHINLYVNKYSIDLGIAGKEAILNLLNIYKTENKADSYKAKTIFLGSQLP